MADKILWMEFRQLDGRYKHINKSVEHLRGAVSGRGNTQPSAARGTGGGLRAAGSGQFECLCEYLSCFALALQQRLKTCNTLNSPGSTFICLTVSRMRRDAAAAAAATVEKKMSRQWKCSLLVGAHTHQLYNGQEAPSPPHTHTNRHTHNCLPFTTSVPLTVAINYGLGVRNNESEIPSFIPRPRSL